MKNTVTIVYRGPDAFKVYSGLQLWFTRDEPQEVSPRVAAMLIGNNPTPEQAKRERFHDVFEVLFDEGAVPPPHDARADFSAALPPRIHDEEGGTE